MATLPKTSVSFVLNGKVVVVEDASPNLSLNEWIRCQPGLTGTKRMCGEGGCGCCVVAATFMDPLTQKETTLAINSVRKFFMIQCTKKFFLQSRHHYYCHGDSLSLFVEGLRS